VRYPGTYVAGGYNRLLTTAAGRVVEAEDLVNLPNWLNLELGLPESGWFDERQVHLTSYRQELDLKHGMLLRAITFEDHHARRTTLRERRFVSMAEMHTAALEITLTAENWSGPVTVRSGIDGRVVNAGAKLYEKFNNNHLQPIAGEIVGEDAVMLLVRTSQSNLHIGQSVRTRVYRGGGEAIEPARRPLREPGYIGQEFDVQIGEGETLRIEKLAVLYTSRVAAISEPGVASRTAVARAQSFETTRTDHVLVWRQLWRRFDMHLLPSASMCTSCPQETHTSWTSRYYSG
jgi:trehalose/maltose hydrolase-like predicted phosphorylase